MVRTYSYLLMNYKRLGQVKEAKGVIDEGRKVFGPIRHNTRMSSLKVNMASVRDTPALPQPSPIYPPSALASGTEGECDVRFDVDMDGGQPMLSLQLEPSNLRRRSSKGKPHLVKVWSIRFCSG